jgi:HPr kinase/phosphorylase
MKIQVSKTGLVHSSCVCVGNNAALILGRSGLGKSDLALQLMAYGAELVADDQTCLSLQDGQVLATCPSTITGQIEARGVGILAVASCAKAIVRCVIDLNTEETDRHPPVRHVEILNVKLPLLHRSVQCHFPAAILLYLKGGRIEG